MADKKTEDTTPPAPEAPPAPEKDAKKETKPEGKKPEVKAEAKKPTEGEEPKADEKPAKPKYEGPWYHVTAAVKAVRKEYSIAQRAASMFSEAPRIGSTVLRRGTVVKLREDQVRRMEAYLYRLHRAHAIDIHRVDKDGEKVELPRHPHFGMLTVKSPMPVKKVVKKKAGEEEELKDDASSPSLSEEVKTPTELHDEKADLNMTQEVKIVPPPEAKKDGPDPTASKDMLPTNPLAAASSSEVEEVVESVKESETKSGKKKGKKSSTPDTSGKE